jgi:hypothetical protein
MKRYTVTAQIEVDGTTYPVGASIELTDEQAVSVPGCVMECPVAPVTAAKPATTIAALASVATPKTAA